MKIQTLESKLEDKDLSNFLLRNEKFGSILFSKEDFEYFMLNKHETDYIVKKYPDIEHIKNQTEGIRNDIISSPIRVYYELTTGCNLRCKTCFNKSGKPIENELPTEEVLKIIEGLKKDNVFDVRFTGGEVTTKEGWDKILFLAKDLGFGVSLNTNAQFDDETIEKLIKIKPHQITVSIDGLERNHNLIRGKRTFEKAYNNIKKLYAAGLATRTNTIITRNNLNEADEIIKTFKNYASDMAFFNMRIMGRALDISSLCLSYEEIERFNKRMDSLVKIHQDVNLHYRESGTTSNGMKEGNEFGLLMGRCPGGITRFVITSEGNTHTCGYMPYINPKEPVIGANLGNVVKNGYSIKEIWQNSKRLNEFRELNKYRTKICINCTNYETVCPGICLADEFNRINNKGINPYCKL
jgi:radical SAM protein with 4Fe4S-binding SPASM domain